MSDELEQKIEEVRRHRRRFFVWFLPFDYLTKRLVDRMDAERPQWDEDEYSDWETEDLTWRIIFLQGCARDLYAQTKVLTHRVLPLVAFVAALVGFVLGHYGK